MSRYLYLRGKGSRRRVMHIAHYNAWGEIDGAWCDRARYNTSINVPLGRPACKICLRKIQEASH